jgi:hypothetical protein
MASINFFANSHNLNGSGLGFYGTGFGQSVNVGQYQDTTFITNSNGTAQGQQVNNIEYLNSASGIINSASSGVWLKQIPNYLATLNIQFTNATAVKAQNVQLYIYDRSSINNPASGVLTQVAELIHPDSIQNNNGSGSATWQQPAGSAVVMTLANSPGSGGLYAGNGSNSTRSDTEHDWYLAISASPNSIGSKTLYGLYVSLEYL